VSAANEGHRSNAKHCATAQPSLVGVLLRSN